MFVSVAGRQRRPSPFLLAAIGCLAAIGSVAFATPPAVPAFAPGLDFKQAANSGPPVGQLLWISGILAASNSIYAEGMSVPLRAVFVAIPATPGNTHVLSFSVEATKGGSPHSYDFLTSWDQAIQAGQGLGPLGENLLDQLADPAAICGPVISAPVTLAICESLWKPVNNPVIAHGDLPDAMGSIGGGTGDVVAQVASYEAYLGNRQITVRAPSGNALSNVAVVFIGYTLATDSFAQYELHWTSASTTIGIELAGHLAAGLSDGIVSGYGAGWGAAALAGGPYHVKLEFLDGVTLGVQDDQIKGADILPALPGAWTDLGAGLAGLNGVPILVGDGTLAAGSAGSLTLAAARASAICAINVALSSTPTPFKGGTLLAFPPLLSVPLVTSAGGSLHLPFTWPSGVPSGSSLWYQVLIADAAAVHGVALSNALKATTP